ncbi:MAG: sulfatase [Verrucomicrobiota bacterium]
MLRIPIILWFLAVGVVAERPNILFISVDDMNDWVGFLGGYPGAVHTPNIDALSRRGVAFTNAHCASPVCCPSRTAVMTGLMPSSSGIYNNSQWWKPHRPDLVTIPMHFRRHGYEVVGAGKIFHHTAGSNPPGQWDVFHRLTFQDDPWFRGNRLNYPWTKPEPNPKGFPFSNVPALPHENDWGVLPLSESSYDDARSVDFAIEFLGKEHTEPFFLACGLFRPHLPWYTPQRYVDLYPLNEIREPVCRDDDLDDVPAEGKELSEARRGEMAVIKKAGKYRQAIQAYLASLSFADAQIGRLLRALEKSEASSRTIIVLWSDHGWHLGEKQHWHKSTLWEEATRVPLIISAPDLRPARCEAPVSLVDLFPTLTELCHLPAVPWQDGRSLQPLLREPSRTDGFAMTQFKPGQASVRSHAFRYIRYADGGEELYDHRADPHEWNNVVLEPRWADERETHAARITRDWADPAPSKKAYAFDPATYSWTTKQGVVIDGRN